MPFPASHELIQRQSVLEDRRCGAARGSFAVGDPVMGEPGADAAPAHGKQVPAVYGRRREAAEAGAFSAESARVECSGDCGVAAPGGTSASSSRRRRRSDWLALASIAGEEEAVSRAGGSSGWHLGGIPERAGAVADERVGGNAAQAGAILQNQHFGFF